MSKIKITASDYFNFVYNQDVSNLPIEIQVSSNSNVIHNYNMITFFDLLKTKYTTEEILNYSSIKLKFLFCSINFLFEKIVKRFTSTNDIIKCIYYADRNFLFKDSILEYLLSLNKPEIDYELIQRSKKENYDANFLILKRNLSDRHNINFINLIRNKNYKDKISTNILNKYCDIYFAQEIPKQTKDLFIDLYNRNALKENEIISLCGLENLFSEDLIFEIIADHSYLSIFYFSKLIYNIFISLRNKTYELKQFINIFLESVEGFYLGTYLSNMIIFCEYYHRYRHLSSDSITFNDELHMEFLYLVDFFIKSIVEKKIYHHSLPSKNIKRFSDLLIETLKLQNNHLS